MDLPASLQWFEADQPHVIGYKEERLSSETPRCRLERVKIDLSDAAARRELLSRINARAPKLLVMTEGVLPYLTAEQVGALADDLHGLRKICCWITEYHSPESVKYRERAGMRQKMQNAPFRFKPDDWFGFFRQHGWEAKEIRYLAEEADRVRRPIPLPLIPKIFFTIRALAASRERRAAFREFAAYVLLEPATAGTR
jgi:O-methyltransferase involved in polyketide biosynthesis